MTIKKYVKRNCYSCDAPIMVAPYDLAVRNYCQTCAWSKLNAIR